MPVDVTFCPDGIGVVWTSRGKLSARDLLDADDVIAADPERLERLRYLLVDHTHAEGMDVSADDIRSLAGRGLRSNQIVERAWIAIAAPDLIMYGMTRMWEIVSRASFESHVARSREEAVTWLREQVREALSVEIELPPAD